MNKPRQSLDEFHALVTYDRAVCRLIGKFVIVATSRSGHVWFLKDFATTDEAKANAKRASLGDDNTPASYPKLWTFVETAFASDEAERNLARFEDEPRPRRLQ